MSDSPAERVRVAVGSAGLALVGEPARAGDGRRNDVWFAPTDDGEVVVRLLADDRRLVMEQRVLDVAADAGIPVAGCRWASADPFPVMVQGRLSGRPLTEVEPSTALLADLARILRLVHGVAVSGGFGNLDAELRGATLELSVWFVDRVREEAAHVRLGSDDFALVDAAVARMAAGSAVLDRQRPGLVHGDVQPTNILVEDDRVTGLLDWEAAKSGPPALDFGWWDWWSTAFETPWSTDELLDAYDPDGGLDRVEVAEVRQLVQLRVWARELLAAARGDDRERTRSARRGIEALV